MSCTTHAGETFSGRRNTSENDIFDSEAAIIPERKYNDVPAERRAAKMDLNRDGLSKVLLNGLIRGQTSTTRTGNVVRWTNIGIHGIIESDIGSTGVSDPALVSIWIAYDKQTNGATFADTDFIQYGSGALPTPTRTSPSSQFLSMENAERWVVLKHFMVTLGPHEKGSGSSGFTGSPMTALVNWNLDVDLETVYRDNTGTVSDIRSGAIWLIGAADVQATQVTPTIVDDWKLQYHTRLRYMDP